MFDDVLLNYGMAGVFIAYLIYDKQVVMRSVVLHINANTLAVQRLCALAPVDKKKVQR